MSTDTQTLWEEYSSKLRSFISHKVSNTSDVDDLLQDIFLKVAQHKGSLGHIENHRSWLYQIASNTITDYYRKHKVRFEDIADFSIEDASLMIEDPIDDESPEREIAAGLRSMVEDLPGKYAQAIKMVVFQGISQVELSEKLGISVSGAKSRIQRGRLLLRNMLMKCCHFKFDRFGTIIDYEPLCCCSCT